MPPSALPDTLPNADRVIEILENAKEENLLSPMRIGQVVILPTEGEVWMTGDIHDHRTNFAKLVAAADLPNNPNRHLVLHELIHGDHFDPKGCEDSWRTLIKAAELKCDYPQQVHFLLANHDLAQIHGEGIMKSGLSVCEAFNKGVRRDFGDHGAMVNVMITDYLLSLPLAIRTQTGIWFSHSLPTDEQIKTFDYDIFSRESPLGAADYKRRVGPVYQLIWGRGVTPAGVSEFAEAVGADLLVTGHQPQEMGYFVNGEQHLIIASDHNQGCFLPLDLSASYTVESMTAALRKYVALESSPETN